MIIDAHVHIYNSQVIDNVLKKTEMIPVLGLETESVNERTGKDALVDAMTKAGISACLTLPTSNAESVKKINDQFLGISESSEKIHTAFTLHPGFPGNGDELRRFSEKKIHGIKLCSFSQGFALNGEDTIKLLDRISEENARNSGKFFIVLDTFYNASDFFGTNPVFDTKPGLLGDVARNYPGINFIAAHMGGLNAPVKEILEFLPALNNLYLDTSNAAHTLSNDEFVHLLRMHGPERIIFGTDWPWFSPVSEIVLIKTLLKKAGFSKENFTDVFAGNIAGLLGITGL